MRQAQREPLAADDLLTHPLSKPVSATLTGSDRNTVTQPLNAGQLINEGLTLHLPANDAVLLHIQGSWRRLRWRQLGLR